MKPKSLVVCVALLVGACESRPGVPLPIAPAGPTSPASPLYTLSGVVTAAGRPAAGARVTVLELQPEPSATTDDNGYYSIPGLGPSSFWGRTLVRFSHPGYFTDFKRPSISEDTRLDVTLDPLVFIALGEPVRGRLIAGDAMCAGKDYDEDSCQRFAVSAPAAGILEVTLRSSGDLPALDVVNPDGEAFAEFLGPVKRVSLPARAGGTYEIRLVIFERAPAEFELMASLR